MSYTRNPMFSAEITYNPDYRDWDVVVRCNGAVVEKTASTDIANATSLANIKLDALQAKHRIARL